MVQLRSLCGSQHRSSHQPLVWGQKRPPHQNLQQRAGRRQVMPTNFCKHLERKQQRTNSLICTWRRYRLTQRSSPMSMPSVGPTWYSHCAGITSALVPDTLTTFQIEICDILQIVNAVTFSLPSLSICMPLDIIAGTAAIVTNLIHVARSFEFSFLKTRGTGMTNRGYSHCLHIYVYSLERLTTGIAHLMPA